LIAVTPDASVADCGGIAPTYAKQAMHGHSFGETTQADGIVFDVTGIEVQNLSRRILSPNLFDEGCNARQSLNAGMNIVCMQYDKTLQNSWSFPLFSSKMEEYFFAAHTFYNQEGR
jgi:hypothetical protein